MTFNEAYVIATQNSADFRQAVRHMQNAIRRGEKAGCLIFAFGPVPTETFYYGFDGVDLNTGKHRADVSRVLLAYDRVLIINTNWDRKEGETS